MERLTQDVSIGKTKNCANKLSKSKSILIPQTIIRDFWRFCRKWTMYSGKERKSDL